MLVYLPLLYSFPAMNLQNVKTEDQLVNPPYSLFPMFESRLHVDKDHNHSTWWIYTSTLYFFFYTYIYLFNLYGVFFFIRAMSDYTRDEGLQVRTRSKA